jgi:hypothetical protein
MARATKDPALSARYIKRANEYQVLADAVPLGQATKNVRQREQQQERKARRRA